MRARTSEMRSLYVGRDRVEFDSNCLVPPSGSVPLPFVVPMPRVSRRISSLLSKANLRRRVQRRVPGAPISAKSLSAFTSAVETYVDDLADGAGFEWQSQVTSRRLQGKGGMPRLSARHVQRALAKNETTPKVKPDGVEIG